MKNERNKHKKKKEKTVNPKLVCTEGNLTTFTRQCMQCRNHSIPQDEADRFV